MDKNIRIPQQDIQVFWKHGSNVIPISQKVCCYPPSGFHERNARRWQEIIAQNFHDTRWAGEDNMKVHQG
jgi:hypothetical protein